MRKVVAIAFSDCHFHKWQQFNEGGRREILGETIFRLVSDECKKYGVPALFLGDIAQDPEQIYNSTLNLLIKSYREYFEYPKIMMIGISGNHDQCGVNTFKTQSPSYLNILDMVFSTFSLIDYKYIQLGKLFIAGIPYNSRNIDLPIFVTKLKKKASKNTKQKILLLHADLPGAKDPSGFFKSEVNNVSSFDELSRGYDLVLSGHIHKFQQLGKKVYCIGATNHQRRSDLGTTMGITRIYSDNSIEFVPLKLPEFKYIPSSRTTPPDKFHYWIQVPDTDDDYTKIESGDIKTFKPTNDPIKIGKKYLKLNSITNKQQKTALIKSLK